MATLMNLREILNSYYCITYMIKGAQSIGFARPHHFPYWWKANTHGTFMACA